MLAISVHSGYYRDSVVIPVSVQICTLNEQRNIRECILASERASPKEIIVIDGGSSDRTVEIARSLGILVLEAGAVGLAEQRRLGYLATEEPYVAFIDADDRLAPGALSAQLDHLKSGGYSALQFMTRAATENTWIQRGWARYAEVSIVASADTNIVGRPAVFDRSSLILASASVNFRFGSEDTAMSQSFVQHGLRQGISSIVARRDFPSTYEESARKWRSYGRGYRQFVETFPERRYAITRHLLVTIPISRTWPFVRQGQISQLLFGFLYSVNCLAGWFSFARSRP